MIHWTSACLFYVSVEFWKLFGQNKLFQMPFSSLFHREGLLTSTSESNKPDHSSTVMGDKVASQWLILVLIASTKILTQSPQHSIFKLLFHPHWRPLKIQNFTPQLVRKENVINITPVTIFNRWSFLKKQANKQTKPSHHSQKD